MDQSKGKTYLFIDGSNLYSAQYEIFGPNKYLSFPEFISLIEKNLKIKFDQIYFYGSYTPRKDKPTLKERQFIINEFKFYQSVKLVKNLIFFKGYRSKTSGKEKEVDVKLSVDLVGYGLLGDYDEAFLMTGDADFLQAVFFVKKHKADIRLSLICIENRILYKGLFYLPSYVFVFGKKILKNEKIARKAKIVYIKKTAELCPRLR